LVLVEGGLFGGTGDSFAPVSEGDGLDEASKDQVLLVDEALLLAEVTIVPALEEDQVTQLIMVWLVKVLQAPFSLLIVSNRDELDFILFLNIFNVVAA